MSLQEMIPKISREIGNLWVTLKYHQKLPEFYLSLKKVIHLT